MSSTQTPEIPSNTPSPEPTKPPIDNTLTDLQMKVIADKERENRELRARLTRMEESEKNKIQQPPPPNKISDEEINKKYFTNPAETLRALMGETVAPLTAKVDSALSFVEDTRNSNSMAEILNQFKSDSRYRDKWSVMEPVLLEILRMHTSKGGKVDYDTVNNAVLSAIGLISSGQINGVSFDNRPSAPPNRDTPRNDMPPADDTPNRVITPPHLMPSNPPPPAAPSKQYRQLDENERLLARQRGWTDAEYLNQIGGPNEKLIITDFGQKKKGGKR